MYVTVKRIVDGSKFEIILTLDKNGTLALPTWNVSIFAGAYDVYGTVRK